MHRQYQYRYERLQPVRREYDADLYDDAEDIYNSDGWTEISSETSTVFAPQEVEHEALQARGARTPIDPNEIYKLKPGDHIGWHRPYIIWHHAIVKEVDIWNRKLLVIHFTKSKGLKIKKEEWINVDKQWGEMFRFDYPDDVTSRNPPNVVLERAEQGIGERNYKFVKNNCEHFATFCKTGKAECVQAKWAAGKLKETARITAMNATKATGRFACNVAKVVVNQSAKYAAENAGKVAVAETIETVGKATDVVGAGLVVAFEAAHCAYDIYHIRKRRQRGEMTDRDFKVTTTQRVSEAVCGSALAVGGSLLGGFLGSFIPGIGTAIGAFVGSVVGGFVGNMVGKAIGSIFGNWFGNKIW